MPRSPPAPVIDRAGRMAKSNADAIGKLAVEMRLDSRGQLPVNELVLRPSTEQSHGTAQAAAALLAGP